jgi:hypothetical protein
VGEHRSKSVDSSWSEPFGVAVATAPTRSLPVAPSALAAGTETHAAMSAAVPAPARSDDATPIVSPLPATPLPALFPVAPRNRMHRLLPFALAGGALLGVVVAVLSVVLPAAPSAAPAPAPAPAAPAPAPAPDPARVAAPAPAAKPVPKKKKPRAPVKKKPVAKRAVKR